MQIAGAGGAQAASSAAWASAGGLRRPSTVRLRDVQSQNAFPMNQAGFEMMVRAYSSDLFRFAYWLCRNRWQAQDLVQETFAAAWKSRDSLRDHLAAKAWLFTILRNEHARTFQRKQLDMEDVDPEDLPIASNDNALERVELEDCLRELPENYREPLLLQVLGGFSGKEIAQMLDITEQNVMTRLTRARQALQRLAAPGGGKAKES
jgi:RNA polymerase sigma-70 factor, ECF subfamily